MTDKPGIYKVRLGAEMQHKLPENGQFEAPNGFVITTVDVSAGTVYCKPLQIEIDLNDCRQWVNIQTK